MIVDYRHDPARPDGAGRVFREIPDGAPFTWYADVQDAARRRAVTCIATGLVDAHPGSAQPYDRRLAVELTTGHAHWLTPGTAVVTAPLKVVVV